MKIVLVVAVSKDGFIADSKHDNPESWTSAEDKKQFRLLLQKYPLQIMGANTYKVHRPKATASVHRIVLTNSPDAFASEAIEGQLEFINTTPADLVSNIEPKYPSCVLLGGSAIYSEFLLAGLVDEMFITREPVLLGDGIPFLTLEAQKLLSNYEPSSSKPLNDKGTQLEYYVLKK